MNSAEASQIFQSTMFIFYLLKCHEFYLTRLLQQMPIVFHSHTHWMECLRGLQRDEAATAS